MDAIRLKLSSLLILFFLATSCSQTKTATSVFPDSQGSATGACSKQSSISEKRFIVQWEDGSFTVEKDENADAFRRGFVEKNLSLIKHVDRDVKFQVHSEDFSQGSETAASGGGLNWGPELIQAPALWNQNIQGDGMVVGVVDGMVDVTHAQLQPNIFINEKEIPNNGIDDDGNGFIDDYMGVKLNTEVNNPDYNRHGSHVSGIIAADSSKGPVKGVAPKAKILPAQFINNSYPNGTGGDGNIGDAILGINYVVDRGAKIINLSWGTGPCTEIPTLKSALQQISDRGVLIVTAAGNGDQYGVGINVDSMPTYPSAYNFLNQLNVAASTFDDYLISFSNFGFRTVHVAAPGVGIYSTTPGNRVESMSGTSMASPMTSGAAALIWSAVPSATAAQVKQALIRSVDIVPGRQIEVQSRGRINVNKAYAELRRLTNQ